MKSTLSSLMVILTGLLFIPIVAYGQEQEGCFMLDINGQPINLGHVCGISNVGNPKSSNSIPGVYTIPIIRREGGIPIVKVIFNNQHDFEMMVDTGASATVLSQKMAVTIGVKEEGVLFATTPSHNLVKFPTGRVNSIGLGGMVKENLAVAISPNLNIGLLGQNFFGGYDVTIREKEIEFRAR